MKEQIQNAARRARPKRIGLALGAVMGIAAAACGGGKEGKSYNPNTGITIAPITPGLSKTVEASPVVVRPIIVPIPTIEAAKVPLSAEKGLAQMVQGKLKPQFASFDMAGAIEKTNDQKKSKSKTKEIGRLGTDPNQLNYSFEEGLDGKAFGWSFTVDQAGLGANDIPTAMSVLGNFLKEVPDAGDKSWTTQKKGNTTAYELVTQNADGSMDSIVAIVVPGINPGKWVYRTGFCHVTSADPNRASNSCVGLQ